MGVRMDHTHSRATATAVIAPCTMVVAGVMAAYLFSPWADQLGGTG